jgi:hypothetical protein
MTFKTKGFMEKSLRDIFRLEKLSKKKPPPKKVDSPYFT